MPHHTYDLPIKWQVKISQLKEVLLARGGHPLQDIVDVLGKIASIITPLLLIIGFLGSISKKGKGIIAEWFKKINAPQNKAVLCVLRTEIRNMCMICICRGYITRDEWEDLTEASEAYEGLGGNSSTHRLVERAINLPIKEKSEAEHEYRVGRNKNE